MKDIIDVEKRELAGIPCLVFQPKLIDMQKLVVLYHGWGSRKEDKRFLATLFALHGFRVVAPDAALHGERGQLPVYHSSEGYRHFWEVIIRSVEESGDLLQAILQERLGEPERIAVAGTSMGGITAMAVFARHPQLRTLVNLIGSGAWEVTEQSFRRLEGRPPAEDSELVDIRKYDPMNHLHSFFPRPIFLTGGDADRQLPVDGQQAVFAALSPLYQERPERLKLQVVPRSGHYVTEGMLAEAIRWLQTYL